MYVVVGVLGGLAALILLISFGGFGGLMVQAERADFASGPMVQVIRFFGSGIIGIMLLLAIPSVVVGLGLMKFNPWARALSMVVATLHLANIPIGTVLAIYSFWVLMSPETEPLFSPTQR
ncbi:MAG: hypothetical protein K2X03_15175 [Bryobacteraceae bacterium]|nr:hypothetical protein [Bryobacteraceae bacterium]